MGEGKKKEKAYQIHQPASYWYKIVSIDPNYTAAEKKIYKGEDAAVQHFIFNLVESF